MRSYWTLLVAMGLAGCATHRPVTLANASAPAEPSVVREAASTHEVETRYDVRSYRDVNDPSVRHEAHAVYRSTRVPTRVDSLATAPRGEFAPISYAPLPPSAELSAELAAQKQITADLHAIEARMAVIEQQAQGQYGTLVNQTAETVKLRQQLEAERARARDLEAKLRDRVADVSATGAPVTAATEPKW